MIFTKEEKVILVDAVGCLVNLKGEINHKVFNLIEKFKNKKIVLTNANNSEKKIFLRNVNYEIFTLNHNPNKPNPEYFRKFLFKYNFSPKQLVYFEHNIDAVKSAQSQGIVTHHFDNDLGKLKYFLDLNLNSTTDFQRE